MRAKRNRTDSAGYTLTELMVVVAITGFIMASLYQMLIAGQQSAERSRVMTEIQQNARIGLESLADDIRQVSYGKDPTQPSIHYAGPDSCTFIADIDPTHPGAERISFFLSPDGDPDTENPDDTVLMRVVADTSGNVLVSAPQSYGIRNDGLNFRWFNGGGVELANPVPSPEQVGEVAIELTAAASHKLGDSYPSMTLTNTIYPRNLPLSPARSRPSMPAASGPTYPNCESATVTWTAPTTNTDGTTLEFADIAYFNFYTGTESDDMQLYTRLARTITSWTVNGLEAGTTYYLGVTCVSRSGVESYTSMKTASVGSTMVPLTPGNFTVNVASGVVNLSWNTVTHFESGDPITTPVTYQVHRSKEPGIEPSEDTLIYTVTAGTTYTDTGLTACNTYYYLVLAKACSNLSEPTSETSVLYPSPPNHPTSVAATLTGTLGEIKLSWTPPVNRIDGTTLASSDIENYYCYLDTVPGQHSYYEETSDNSSSYTFTGLPECQTYYMNVRAVDSCGNPGDLLTSNEVELASAAACDASPPGIPSAVTLTPYSSQVHIEWASNMGSCDLQGYKLYYGHTAGGPYNGTEAAQGASPIYLDAHAITNGDACIYNLTGLPSCQYYAIRVTALDNCTPPNESSMSTEKNATTTCIPCTAADICALWGVNGTGNKNVNLELYSTSGSSETITKLKPVYSSGIKVKELWYGEPLAKIWASDGSAGGDGNIGAQGSGVTLNCADFSVSSTTKSYDGTPLAVYFDGDARDIPMTFSMTGNSGTCDASGTGRGTSWFDNFDDNNYTGWTPNGGTWTASSYKLGQTNNANNYIMKLDSPTSLGDCTIEAKVKVTGGSFYSFYIVYRYQDANNCGLFGIRTDQDKVRAARLNSSTFTETAAYSMTLNDNTWYNLKVVIVNKRVKGYVNCTQVIDVTDSSLWSTGGVGLTWRKGTGDVDDVKIYTGEALP